MHALLWSVRYALRAAARTPTFTAAAVATIAIGVGTATSIISVVDAVMLKPLPFRGADQLLQIRQRSSRTGELQNWLSYPNFRDLSNESRTFTAMAAYQYAVFSVTGGSAPEAVVGLGVSANFFQILGVAPLIGTAFSEQIQSGDDRVVVISHDLWVRRFGSQTIVGQTVSIDNKNRVIVAVMPDGFNFPVSTPVSATLPSQQMQVWIPFDASVEKSSRGDTNFWVFGRFKPGMTAEQAQADVTAVAAQLQKRFPRANRDFALDVTRLGEFVTGPVGRPMLLLLAAAVVVLLIAYVDVANLLLARASARTQEVAVRVALGAGRGRLLTQLLVESITLSVAGWTIGVVIANGGVHILKDAGANTIPRLQEATVDGRVLLFSLVLTLLIGALAGIVPALRTWWTDVSGLLTSSVRATEGGRASRLHNALITLQVALAIVLLIAASLLTRTFFALHATDRGFDTKNVLTGWIMLPGTKYADGAAQMQAFQGIDGNIRRVFGIECGGLVSALPLSGISNDTEVSIERAAAPLARTHAELRVATPGYFCAIGLSLLSGRSFRDGDIERTGNVAIVNAVAARRFWPNEDAIGKRLSINQNRGTEVWREVIGVVKNVRHKEIQSNPEAEVYVPLSQYATPIMVAAIRTAGSPENAITPLRLAVTQVDKDQPVFNIRTMDALLASAVALPRLQAIVVVFFGLSALTLCGVGVYGVVAYLISLRRREFAIRIALGATPPTLITGVLRRAMTLVAIGLAGGLTAAFFASRAMQSLLFGVAPFDLTSVVGMSSLIVLLCLVASYVPVSRAMRAPAAASLRLE